LPPLERLQESLLTGVRNRRYSLPGLLFQTLMRGSISEAGDDARDQHVEANQNKRKVITERQRHSTVSFIGPGLIAAQGTEGLS
jgi:hypothetical protein